MKFNMFVLFIILLIIVWWIVIYLSLWTEKKTYTKEDNYEDTIFYYQLNNLKIKNEKILKLKENINKYIVGSDNLINSIIVWILAKWHILVEWVPGLAKTKTILVFSKMLWLNFQRIQFTPDMLPSDIIWWEIYNKNVWKFEVMKWPIFTNLLLADEINRATPKTQSALLEAMQEKTVSIWKNTFVLDKPFFVMATQNPLEQDWTFPLPEAQLDRFLFKVKVWYPTFNEELEILDKFEENIEKIEQVIWKDEIINIQEEIKDIQIPKNIKEYIVKLVETTRQLDDNLMLGAWTRWITSIKQASMVVAYLRWNSQVDYEDVKSVALLALNHRIKLSNKALSSNKKIENILIRKFIWIKDFII